jgi:polysaccharide export outer membrane protein
VTVLPDGKAAYPMVGEVVAAGGPDQFAKVSRIKIFRREGKKTFIIPFDYDDVIAGKNLESNILLRRGEVVVVP